MHADLLDQHNDRSCLAKRRQSVHNLEMES